MASSSKPSPPPPARSASAPPGRPRRGVRRRADAERSIQAILAAGLRCFLTTDDVHMTDVARAADVSRVTLYAHFASREELLAAVLERQVAHTDELLQGIDRPELAAAQALAELLRTAWQALYRLRGLRTAAARLLPEHRVREQHERVLSRVRTLVARGQQEGDFRTDLPTDWLVAVVYTLQHAAADEVDAGRLAPVQAADALTATVAAALRPVRA